MEKLLLRQDRQLQDLERKVLHQNTENRELRGRLSSLNADNLALRDSVSVLTAKNQKLEDLVSALISHQHNVEDRVSVLKAENDDLKERYVLLGDRVKAIESATSLLPSATLESKVKVLKPEVQQRVTQSENKQGVAQPEGKRSETHDIVARSDDTGPLEPVVSQMTQQMTEMSSEIQALKNTVQEAGHSVYIRWGHSACPASSADLVYSGVVGGSNWAHTGAAVNYLCLSLEPVFSSHPVPSAYAFLYGGEYQTYDDHLDKDPVCAVCRSRHPTTILVPGTNVCQAGGYLMAGDHLHRSASEYVCVDYAMQNRFGGDWSENGKLFFYTVTECGALPCVCV
nr:hypothetical protein BaRGS_010470 [Batillaria attramentaria]